MNIQFKITSPLLAAIRQDLHRPHSFAYERVGFIAAGIAASVDGILILAHSYRPVADADYLPDPSVGAMMGADAIRKAMQWALSANVSVFHVHSHGGRGVPRFSGVDVRESAKFIPDFLKVAPQRPHGAIVLSNNAAYGLAWVKLGQPPLPIRDFSEVGMPLRRWRAA